MNFLVVGPGAMGCLFASRLKKAGHHVMIVDYRPERADFINKTGILIEGAAGEERVHVPVVTGKVPEETDVALICVKANQTREAAEEISSWLDIRAVILTLQNGAWQFRVVRGGIWERKIIGWCNC